MTKTVFSLFITLYLAGCNSGQAASEKFKKDTIEIVAEHRIQDTTTTDTITKASNSLDSLKSRLKGLWTDGSTEAATFDIKDKTIYYVDEGGDYKYSVSGNVITIKYPDYIYKAKLSFQSDTLIMSSEDYGEAKFWRFKN